MSEQITPMQNIDLETDLSGFSVDRIQKIPEIRSTAYIFTHKKTGAKLIHLFNQDPNNLFSVAFRTPVEDSTGVPHILEHSVLCGSKKFPSKDPFQELLKGSLQTFLNALTYPDKTVYPVSSQVEKDYYNLVDVYCDAVFNPLITESTFYQEGWHFELEEIDKPVSIKGIVYNEMKGVFSQFSTHVSRKTISSLFPDTTYFHESGGDPQFITDLTYEQFREFHSKFYHPSNSFIFLYGNLPSAKTLEFLDRNYLSGFDQLKINSRIKTQPLWKEPKEISYDAPAPKEDDGTATVVVSWIFGNSTDPVDSLSGSILSHYLLGTESSPLKRALIDSGLGEDIDDFSGFDAELVQSVFAAGLRRSKPENGRKIKELIFSTLEKEVEKGLDKELLEGALRQVEFSRREIAGGYFPYNLKLADRCYRSWIYDGDPLAHLAFEKPLEIIKKQTSEGGYFEELIRSRLIENPHHLLSVVRASSEMGEKLEFQTEKQARELAADFNENEKIRIRDLTEKLIALQKTPSPPEAVEKIPKLKKSDLPRSERVVPVKEGTCGAVQMLSHPIFTSGIVYLDIGFKMDKIPADLLPFVPIYLELMTRCGAGEYSYEQMSRRIALNTGGIDSSVTCRTKTGTENELFFASFFHGKSLEVRFEDMLKIFDDLFVAPDLSNRKQVKDILFEHRNGMASSVISSGHSYAMTDASAALVRSKYIDEMLGGITQLRFVNELLEGDSVDYVIEACKKLHYFIISRNDCVLSLTAQNPDQFFPVLEKFTEKLPVRTYEKEPVIEEIGREGELKGIEISSAVNFAARAWKIPGKEASDLGNLFLLSRNLSTGYLWDKVRVEGGAYGGMASMSVFHPVFACASYRDPNLKSTLEHFELGLEEVIEGIGQDKVDQSIVGAIGKIDSPRTPHGQGFAESMNILTGYSLEFRQKIRNSILEATTDSMRNAAQKVLTSDSWAVTVLGSSAAFDNASKQGAEFVRESLIPPKKD
ncbi:hypothetical protein CHISP_3203 [Chitinispirillum alkaliphilum]|nr:hypothetical protein CHISP_3203 [Chitinispirillum alkaliphilum]